MTLLEDESGGIEVLARKLVAIVEKAAKLDNGVSEILSLAHSATVQFEEAKISLADYQARLEADPAELESLRERLAVIARLERKYAKNEADLVAYYVGIEKELSAFAGGEFDEAHLAERADALRVELAKQEAKLTKARKAAAKKLEQAVNEQLAQVNMSKARFEVLIENASSSAAGADKIEFQLAANPGEPPRPLQKVASGGELSRVLLILKTLVNEQTSPAVQIFDEIDTGIGGAVAQVVGEKIKSLTARHQVILVTHAPQIAALADAHFVIRKESTEHTTEVLVQKLNADERVQEIARMMAGKRVTEKFEASARELLKQSRVAKAA